MKITEKLKSIMAYTNKGVFMTDIEEIAILKDQIEELDKRNKELKAELEKWKEEHHEQVLLANEEGWNRTMLQIENTKLNKENEELKAQIEKMKEDVRTEMSRHSNLTENTLSYSLNKKCCENCVNYGYDLNRHFFICKKSNNNVFECNLIEWELKK